MLDLRGGVLHLDIGEGMGAALVANQERIALREVARVRGALLDLHGAAIGVLPVAAEMPFEMMVLRVFLPMWTIFVPVSAC